MLKQNHGILEKNCHFNQRVSIETILWSCLKYVGLPRFINKLSLRSNLNLLQFAAKMLKSSKFMAQLH